jgi:cytochrome P450
VNPSFAPSALKAIEPTMNRYYNIFLDGVMQKAKQNAGIVEMSAWFYNLNFDVQTHKRC